jgi:hypothetical protein
MAYQPKSLKTWRSEPSVHLPLPQLHLYPRGQRIVQSLAQDETTFLGIPDYYYLKEGAKRMMSEVPSVMGLHRPTACLGCRRADDWQRDAGFACVPPIALLPMAGITG